MEWGKKEIYRLRKKLGMTQEEFAKYLRTRQATVSEWEGGLRKPSPMAQRLLTVIQELEELKAKISSKE